MHSARLTGSKALCGAGAVGAMTRSIRAVPVVTTGLIICLQLAALSPDADLTNDR